ncbi:deazaflavin-dependent oxidoreductase (nitroreductase family) [Gordonia amarae]|nr:deazaflavin-dependent oxidoreductase (nitroreductase family) [Gordonia amarae]
MHQVIYERSGGAVGHRLLFGLPSLLLRTTGRKTGLRRTHGLIYVQDGDDLLVVASNNGDPAAPGWLANIRACPECEFQIGRTVHTAVATVIGPADRSYARRWELVNARLFGLYEKRQRAMTRRIAIVVLSSATERR